MGRYLTGCAFCALAILAKPSAIVVPFLAAALDLGALRRRMRTVLAELSPWMLLAVAGAIVGMAVQPAQAVSVGIPLWERPLIAADAIAFYLRQLVLPLHLAPFYGRTPASVFASGAAWWTWIVPVIAFAAAIASWRRSLVPITALCMLVLGVAPVLGLVPFEFQVNSTTADRYVYLALLGPALLLAWWLKTRPGRTTCAVAAIVVAAYALRTVVQVGYWKSTRTILEHSLTVNAQSDFAHGNLGHVLAAQGEAEAALVHLREAVRLRPDSAQNRLNLGSYLGQTGNIADALEQLEEAVRLDPEYASARATLATALASQGQPARAIEELREATRLEPEFALAYLQLGALLEQSQDPAGAETAYCEALRLDDGLNDARLSLGSLYLQAGRVNEALERLRQAVSVDPGSGAALAELGRALLMAGRPAEAIPHLRKASSLLPDLEYLRAMLASAEEAAR